MRRVLVTGGAGFIGSHVAEAYLRAGDEVVVLDDLSHGRRENVPEGAEFVELDIRDPRAADLTNHHAALRYSNLYGPRHDPHGEDGLRATYGWILDNSQPAIPAK